MVIALYAVSGATTWSTAGAFTLASLLSTGLIAAGVASGRLLFVGDKRLSHAQLLANFTIQMVFMIVEPNLWMIFLGSTLITACYSMVAFTPRQFTWLWLAYGMVTGAAFWLGRHRFGTPPTTGSNLAILWLFYFLGVRRLAMTGAQFSKLREQLSEKNKELTTLLARKKVLASHDELTGALNRRELLNLMAEEVAAPGAARHLVHRRRLLRALLELAGSTGARPDARLELSSVAGVVWIVRRVVAVPL